MKYTCPVCGYAELTRPPKNFSICPCCGTEFGYHDYAIPASQLRERWIAKGAPWFSPARPAPQGWNATVQLMASGLLTRTVGFDTEVTIVKGLIPAEAVQLLVLAASEPAQVVSADAPKAVEWTATATTTTKAAA